MTTGDTLASVSNPLAGGAAMRRAVVCSLELDAAAGLIEALRPTFEVATFRLKHDELRTGTCVPPAGDVAFILHAVDGRTLLLDDDGYYNRLLEAANHRCRGDVFLVLAECGPAPGNALCDPRVVAELGPHQPSVRDLAAADRFFTLAAAPSAAQLAHVARSRTLPRLYLPAGVRELNRKPPPATRRARIGLCPIL